MFVVPPFLPEVASRLVDLDFIGRLSPSNSPLLLVTLVLEAILESAKFYFFFFFLKYYLGHKDIETVKIRKNSSIEHKILF